MSMPFLGRRAFLLAAAPVLLAAKPALASAVCTLRGTQLPPETIADGQRLRLAWEGFCSAADAITAGAHGWQLSAGRRGEEAHFVQFAQVDLQVRMEGGFRLPSERHIQIAF